VKYIIPPSPTLPFLLVFLICSFLQATLVSAESTNAHWEITADKITRYEDPPSVVAEGNVLLEKKQPISRTGATTPVEWNNREKKGGQAESPITETTAETKTLTTIKADWVAYDVKLGKIKARGNLLIDVAGDQMTAESGSIDIQEATGTFEKATVIRKDQTMHLEGKAIEKTGELTYHIADGWIVTCKLEKGETPPWSFGASDVEITDGGYAWLKHATFRIKDVPILYSPLMVLPAKRTRQTGFLFPSIATSSRDGFNLETPFFINLSPSTDITLYPRYYANRGLMAGAEFRYVLDETSKGMWMGNFLADSLSDPSEVDYYQDGQFTHTNSDRYWLRGKADQNIGQWITRLDVDVVSDKDYLREFDSGATGITASQQKFSDTFGRGFLDKTNQYRENTFMTLRSWENGTSLYGDFFIVDDLSGQNYNADNPSRAWKLPSVTHAGLVPIFNTGGPDFSWNANYTNFYREEGVGAQRVDLLPQITTAIPISPYLESTIHGGVRDTLYMIQDNGASDWENNNSENRFFYNLGGELGTILLRDFSVNIGEVNAWSHTLRPYVGYGYTAMPENTVAVFPQFDSIDALEEENGLYYGVDNFFKIFGEQKGREYDREYAFLKIRQGYDLRSQERDTPLTPVNIKTGFYPLQFLRLMYRTDIDVYGEGAFRHAVEADYLSERGDTFALDYQYNSLTDINSVSGSTWYLLPYNFAAGYSLQRALETSETISEKIRLRYTQPCWSVELSADSTPGDQSYMVTFRLANIGSPIGLPGF